jgi:ankyrin repeat protein
VFIAVQNGYEDVVKAFAKHGANVDTSSNDGGTPILLSAAHIGYANVIKALYKLGADTKPEVVIALKHLLQLIEKITNKY